MKKWFFFLGWMLIQVFGSAQVMKSQFLLEDLFRTDPIHCQILQDWKPSKKYLLLTSSAQPSTCRLQGSAEGFDWENANYLVFEVENLSSFSAIFQLDFFWTKSVDKERVKFKTGLIPNLRTHVIVPLSYLSAQALYIPKYPRQLKGTVEGNFLPKSEIASVRISLEPVQMPDFQPKVKIYNVWLSTTLPESLPPLEKPLLDSMGQWASKSWSGKTRSVKNLNKTIQEQCHESLPASQNPRFLGDQQAQFQATGFFRTHHDGKRWWFVDPTGRPFLSSGIDGIRTYSSGPFDGMEDVIGWLPKNDPFYSECFSPTKAVAQFNFLGANLKRALGPDWRLKWQGFIKNFILDHHFNTIGNWSDKDICSNAKLPWVYPMRNFPDTKTKVFRDFPDVFDPSFPDSVRKFAEQLNALKSDSFLIGYFLRNEPEWAFGDQNLAAEMLGNPWGSYSRKRLVSWLRERYLGEIKTLNSVWGEDFKSFEALETGSLSIQSLRSRDELKPFTELLLDSLIGMVCRETKRVDPNHLNLGMRYAYISSDLCYRAGSYFDVFSVNGYGMEAPSQTRTIEERTHKPVLIGEFHIGTLDRGLPASGIAASANSTDRGLAIRHYFEEAFSRPEVIGVHYFQLFDQPFTGRFDGENYQIGLLDICNQPYKRVLDQIREANKGMYRIARKKRSPSNPSLKKVKPIYY